MSTGKTDSVPWEKDWIPGQSCVVDNPPDSHVFAAAVGLFRLPTVEGNKKYRIPVKCCFKSSLSW